MQNSMTAKEWFEKGVTLGRQDKYEEALDAFIKATELDPQDAKAWYNKGVCLGNLGRHKEALDAFNKAIELDPQDAKAWKGKGVALHQLGRDRYEEALDAFNKAIEIDPKDYRVWNNKGVCLGELGKPKEALDAINRAIEINPEYAIAQLSLAEILFDLGDIKQAIKNVDQALQLDKNFTSALLLRGKIEIEQKDYAKASQSFTQAISSDLGNPLPLLWNAYAQYLKAESAHQPDSIMYQQEIAGIIRQLERIKKLVGKGNDEARAYTLYFLGCFYYKTKDIFEAVRTLRECVKFKSESSKGPSEGPSVCELACELLDNIWNYAVRPPLWRWWWFSPLHCRLRRTIFSIISFFIVAPLVASLFTSLWLPALLIDWGAYMFIATILLIILALPNFQRIRARDIEVELRSPPSMEPVLSPSIFEMKIKELEASSEQ